MAILGYFLKAIATILSGILSLTFFLIIAAAVLSWVNPDPYNPIVRFIRGVYNPLAMMVRKRVNLAFGGIDLTPIVLILLIQFMQIFLVESMLHYSLKLTYQAKPAATKPIIIKGDSYNHSGQAISFIK